MLFGSYYDCCWLKMSDRILTQLEGAVIPGQRGEWRCASGTHVTSPSALEGGKGFFCCAWAKAATLSPALLDGAMISLLLLAESLWPHVLSRAGK